MADFGELRKEFAGGRIRRYPVDTDPQWVGLRATVLPVLTQLKQQSMVRADALAVMGNRDRLTFAELVSLVERFSAAFQRYGIESGSVAGVMFANPVRHLVASLALLDLRATQVALSPREVQTIRRTLAIKSGVEILITDMESHKTASGNPTIRVGDDWGLSISYGVGQLPAMRRQMRKANPSEELQPAMFFMGSGTTGAPKLIAPSFDLFSNLIARDLSVRSLSPGERHYCMSSLDYYTAKRRAIGCLSAGVTLIIPDSRPENTLEFCRNCRIDHMSLTTSQAAIVAAEVARERYSRLPALPWLKSLFVGSSPVGEPLRRDLRNLISGELHVVYGSNEFGEATVATPHDLDAHPGTVGRPCPGVTLDIVDNNGEKCSPGETGLIRLKSSPMMSEYPGSPAESSRAFRNDGYYPGDMGRVAQDGNLIFAGRQDDLMIYSGVNIYPRTIENVLESHPCVREAAAFPIANKVNDQRPYAVVVAEGVSEADLIAHCREQLGWRSPIRIFQVASLPRNAAGKVLKRDLANAVAGKLHLDANARKPTKPTGT